MLLVSRAGELIIMFGYHLQPHEHSLNRSVVSSKPLPLRFSDPY